MGTRDAATDTPLIELEHVSHWYGSFHSLRDITARLRPGRIGLLGPNGAGKSTFLKILLGLLRISAGSGRVLGRDLATGAAELRRAIGYMPEADALIPGLRGADYVALAGELYGMPRREAARRAHEVLTYLELEDARYRFLEEYSTGMKQRLKLAQALVHDPPVLLLDEPTSGLDPSGREAMLRLLLTLGRDHGKSVLLSTHLLGDVERVCETVVILHQGRIVKQGTVAELRTIRQDRYRLQIEGNARGFLDDLQLEGTQVLHDNGRGELRLAVPSGWASRGFFALAEHHGVLLRGLARDDEDLEELFHRVLAESDHPDRVSQPSTAPAPGSSVPASPGVQLVGESLQRAGPELLHYRPWHGGQQRARTGIWPIARTSLRQIFTRRLFWILYGLGLMTFFLFFFGQYLMAWAESQMGSGDVRVGGLGRAKPSDLVAILRDLLKLNGSGETFGNFIWYQGYMVMVVLTLAGAVLIGNDLRFGSLPFYLSKPLSRGHYLVGKGLAIAVFINMMTTLPALVLFVQFGLLDDWSYYWSRGYLCLGILAYGLVLTASLTLVLLATATWLRRTVPLIMGWTTLFVFTRFLARGLVEDLHLDTRWRLLDLWNDTYLMGCACLRVPAPGNSPSWAWAALVLGGVCLTCLTYLALRIRAVEIVR